MKHLPLFVFANKRILGLDSPIVNPLGGASILNQSKLANASSSRLSLLDAEKRYTESWLAHLCPRGRSNFRGDLLLFGRRLFLLRQYHGNSHTRFHPISPTFTLYTWHY